MPGVDWLEVSVQVDGEAAEAVSEVLNRYGRGGVVIEHLLTDGKSIYLEDGPGRVIDLLKNSRQPMFLVCVSDQIKRLGVGKPVKKPVRAAASVRQRKPRAV